MESAFRLPAGRHTRGAHRLIGLLARARCASSVDLTCPEESTPTFGGSLTINIAGQKLGASWTELVATVNNQGGIATDPCAFYHGVALSGTHIACRFRPV